MTIEELVSIIPKLWDNNKIVKKFGKENYIENDEVIRSIEEIKNTSIINEIEFYEFIKYCFNKFNYPVNLWCFKDIKNTITFWISFQLPNGKWESITNENNKLVLRSTTSEEELIDFMLTVRYENKEEIDGVLYKTNNAVLDSILAEDYMEKKFNENTEYGIVKNGHIMALDTLMEFMSQPGGIPPTSATDAMMVQYGYNNAFSNTQSAGTDIKLTKISTGENNTDKDKKDKSVDRFFNVYTYTGKKKEKKKEDATLYESICGRKMLTPDQIEYDKDFRLINLNGDQLFRTAQTNITKECCEVDPNNLPIDYLPLISIADRNIAKCKLMDNPDFEILTDNDGYFIINMKTGKRSASVETLDEINPSVLTEAEKFNSIKSEVEYFNSFPGQMIIYDPKDLEDLEDQYNKFYAMHDDERLISNDKSISLFGKNNESRYREMKSKFLNSKLPDNKDKMNLVEQVGINEAFNILDIKNIEKAKDAQISLDDAEFKFKEIKNWSLNSGIYIIMPCENIDDLNDLYNKFSNMPKILKRMSDWKLMEAIGCNNETFYQFQKSIMETNELQNTYPIPLVESVITKEEIPQFPSTNLPLDIPFYSPYELKCFIDSEPLASERLIDKEKIKQWYHEYLRIYNGKSFDRSKLLEWVETIRKYSFKLSKAKTESEENILKETLLELGWNPFIEFSNENRLRAYKRVKRIKVNETVQNLIKESKDIPIQFDNYGNLLITKPGDVDLDKEFFESHRLLKTYYKAKNIDGIKFELCRLWYLNTIAENRIYTKKLSEKELKNLNVSRSRILNDFNKYIKVVLKKEKNFNFNNFYAKSKFDDKQIRVNRSTLKFSFEYLKKVLMHLL